MRPGNVPQGRPQDIVLPDERQTPWNTVYRCVYTAIADQPDRPWKGVKARAATAKRPGLDALPGAIPCKRGPGGCSSRQAPADRAKGSPPEAVQSAVIVSVVVRLIWLVGLQMPYAQVMPVDLSRAADRMSELLAVALELNPRRRLWGEGFGLAG